jgi:3-carboxy-cis,cis-muconate cycloisomerase
VAEAVEPAAAAGGSSTMPQKRNPVRAVLVLAAAGRVPALVSSVLAAMPQEHERGAGGWHVEWDTLPQIVRLASVAAHSTAGALEELDVDAEKMRSNLDIAKGVAMAEAVAMRLAATLGKREAHALVQAAVSRVASENRFFADLLAENKEVARVLSPHEIESLLDPEHYLGSTPFFVEAVLAAYESTRKRNV